MIKTLLLLLGGLLSACSSSSSTSIGVYASIIAGPTYLVDGQRGDDAWDGSISSPWRTIQHALESVPIEGGATIRVSPGEYVETRGGVPAIFIARAFDAPVTVKPAHGAVTVSGDGTGYYSVLAIAPARNVTLEGMRIVGGGSPVTIMIAQGQPVDALRIVDCEIENTAQDGIAVVVDRAPASGVLIEGSKITAPGSGGVAVSFEGIDGSPVLSPLIDRCDISAASTGIAVLGHVAGMTVRRSFVSGGLVSIGKYGGSSPEVTDLTIDRVRIATIGRGLDLGGTELSPMERVEIVDSDIDARQGNRTAVYVQAHVHGLRIEGGTYVGADPMGGGGFYSLGPSNLDFVFRYARFESSQLPGWPDDRVLAAGVGGVQGLLVQGCSFGGYGRGITLQVGTHGAIVEDCTSDAYDMGFRIGSDREGMPGDNSNAVFRRNSVTTLLTPAVVLGEGISDVVIEDNDLTGGDGVIRIRENSSDVTVRRNTLRRHPDGSGTSQIIEEYGEPFAVIEDNTIEE